VHVLDVTALLTTIRATLQAASGNGPTMTDHSRMAHTTIVNVS
jgi:hypothetical protein